METLASLENIIGYKFKSHDKISVAIQHPGFRTCQRDQARDFERLEFLGDRVLGLSLASLFFEKFPSEHEGTLAVRLSVLAGTEFLINLAKRTKLIECFSLPKDAYISKNKNSSSIADMIEAVLGSVFLDSDFETARGVVIRLWGDDIEKTYYKKKDSKTLLQEIAQSKSQVLPSYRLVKVSGAAHDPTFEVEVSLWDISAIGIGNSKKNAEHDAAEKLMEKLSK